MGSRCFFSTRDVFSNWTRGSCLCVPLAHTYTHTHTHTTHTSTHTHTHVHTYIPTRILARSHTYTLTTHPPLPQTRICVPQLSIDSKYRLCRAAHGLSVVFDHTSGNAPHPIPNCEAKPRWARLVLGWGTTRESRGVERVDLFHLFSLIFLPFFFFFSSSPLFVSLPYAQLRRSWISRIP